MAETPEVPNDISSLYDTSVQLFEFTADEVNKYSGHMGLLLQMANAFVNEMRDHIDRVNPSEREGSVVRMLIGMGEYEVAIQAVNTSPSHMWALSIARNCEFEMGG